MKILNDRKSQFILFTFVIFVLAFTLISQVGMAAYCGGPSGCAEGYECVDGDCVPKEEEPECDLGDPSSNECKWGCYGKYSRGNIVCCERCCEEPSCDGKCGVRVENDCGFGIWCGECEEEEMCPTGEGYQCSLTDPGSQWVKLPGKKCPSVAKKVRNPRDCYRKKEEEKEKCNIKKCCDVFSHCTSKTDKCIFNCEQKRDECADCPATDERDCDKCKCDEGTCIDSGICRGDSTKYCSRNCGGHKCCCVEKKDCGTCYNKEGKGDDAECVPVEAGKQDDCPLGYVCDGNGNCVDEGTECCSGDEKCYVGCLSFFFFHKCKEGECKNGDCPGECLTKSECIEEMCKGGKPPGGGGGGRRPPGGGGGGGQTTTTSSSTTTSTSSTTTTTSIPPFDISCDSGCKSGQDCGCEISKGNITSGLWILRGSALKIPIVEDIPPKSLSFKPDKEGEVKGLAIRFSPIPPRVGKDQVDVSKGTSGPENFTCQGSCAMGEDCYCNIRKCNSGKFIANNSLGSPLGETIIKNVNNCLNCTKSFVANSEGKVNATLVCFDHVNTYQETIGINTTGPTPSNTPPQYSNIVTHPENNSLASENDIYYFNSTWTDPDGKVENITLTFNNTKFRLSRDEINKNENEYYRIFENLSVGTYQYRWKAVDNTSNFNQTPPINYKISGTEELQESEVKLTINGNRGNVTVSGDVDVEMKVEELNMEGETLYLYRNLTGTMQKSIEGKDPIEDTISAGMVSEGLYKIIGNWSGNGNYKPDSESWFLNITD